MPVRQPLQTFVPLALFALLAGCAAPPAGQSDAAAEPMMSVRGTLAFRDSIAPPPGSVATIAIGEFGEDFPAAIASRTIVLESSRTMLPFELTAPLPAFDPARRYAVTARVSAPDDGTQWSTEVAQLIDVARERVDVGVLLMAPTRPHPRRDVESGHP